MWGSHYMASRNPLNNSFGMQPQIWPLKPFLSKPQLIGIYFLEADTIVFFMVLQVFFWQLPSRWMEVMLREAGNDCAHDRPFSGSSPPLPSSSAAPARPQEQLLGLGGKKKKKKDPVSAGPCSSLNSLSLLLSLRRHGTSHDAHFCAFLSFLRQCEILLLFFLQTCETLQMDRQRRSRFSFIKFLLI